MSIQIYRPDGDVDATTTRLADPVADLAGCRVVVYTTTTRRSRSVCSAAARRKATRNSRSVGSSIA